MRRSRRAAAVRRIPARVRAAGRVRLGSGAGGSSTRRRRPCPPAQAGARRERVLGLVGACRRDAGGAQARRRRRARRGAARASGPAGLPAGTELRCWEAAVETRDGAAARGRPRGAARRRRSRSRRPSTQRWLAEHPARRSHVQQHRWTVPLRWFVLFDREERRLQLGPRGIDFDRELAAATTRSLVYRTAMAKARRRVARGAAGAAQGAAGRAGRSPRWRRSGAGWRSSTRGRWWSSTTAAWSTCCGDAQLRTDDSAGDVAEALAALQRGDTKACHRRVRTGNRSVAGSPVGGVRQTEAHGVVFMTVRERITRAGR